MEAMSIGNEITNTSPLIEWGVAAQAFAGQVESGDQYLIEPFPNGVLVAVVDGLGHSDGAVAVAKTAVATLEGHAHESVISLLERCHKGLRGSRGVVMSLASFNGRDGTMTWLGVGNVEGLLLRADGRASPACEQPVLSKVEGLLLRGGVVGYKLPTLRPAVIPVTRGDTLIFATDGIRSGFTEGLGPEPASSRACRGVEGLTLGHAPQQTADRILAQYGRGTDDALVLVARYSGDLSPTQTRGAPGTTSCMN
jgi:negative regulator of sigma-B (phosphoserine phosphatase)